METTILPGEIKKKAHLAEKILEKVPCSTLINEKVQTLQSLSDVKEFFQSRPEVEAWASRLDPDEKLAVLSIIAIGEGEAAFSRFDEASEDVRKTFLRHLADVENFYAPIGGVIGYHHRFLTLLAEEGEGSGAGQGHYSMPGAVDISSDTERVREWALHGIDHLPELVEVFPVGGAGDRLSLVSEESGEALPAACLNFAGFSLLEHLIRDVQAFEYLFYKIHRKQLTIPIVMMTSREKHNHEHILSICENNRWFHRDKNTFHLIIQPLAPLIDPSGHWVFASPMSLKLKPGGHGVIWKLMDDASLFDSLLEKGYKKFLARQINNPVASVGHGLLAFIGYGFLHKKTFGFAATARPVHAAEGMLVLKEVKKGGEYEYGITNIEYTDLAKRGVSDHPSEEGGKHSRFPANTNILFGDLEAMKEGVKQLPFPGMLINLKTKTEREDLNGNRVECTSGRIETTMQNVADLFVDIFTRPIDEGEKQRLLTYATYNLRRKTLASTKKSYEKTGSLQGTPEGAYYEQLLNAHELLKNRCGFEVPGFVGTDEYLEKGPNLIFLYHPALGPLYHVIAQKLRRGKIAEGSELQLEISEADIEGLELQGSLIIRAEQALGKADANGFLAYGENEGRCKLQNVRIVNRGINREKSIDWWKNAPERDERLEIVLEGNSEFYAENLAIEGEREFVVPDGKRMIVKEVDGDLEWSLEPMPTPAWEWEYVLHDDKSIKLIN